MDTLYKRVRTADNLFSAWKHVKKSAFNSRNSDIRAKAAEFDHRHHAHIKKIQRQLKEDRFVFDGSEGVLKDAKKREALGKKPRPIVIGTIKNRLVQRAILQILQPRKIVDEQNPYSKYQAVNDKALGKLNDVNCSKYGVGGLSAPYGGVRPAIRSVMEAMENGAELYFQSDIKSFFTAIPTEKVVKIVRSETNDEQLTELFSNGLRVHLANEDELAGYAKLFPKDGIGVAQGSSLSAFAGNVLLYDLDHELNEMGVTAIRYIDDIMILSSENSKLENAIEHCKKRLAEFQFSLYSPSPGSDKAGQGKCRNGFKFLGCDIQPNKCTPNKSSTRQIATEIRNSLNDSKKAITKLARGTEKFNAKHSKSYALDNVGKKLYGWQKSYAFCTDTHPFKALDHKIYKIIENYNRDVSRIIASSPIVVRMQALGIPSTEKMQIHNLRENKTIKAN